MSIKKNSSVVITSVEGLDIRFPTSRSAAGSDALNVDPDYSAAYCILKTNVPGLEGHGLTFTNGRGNDLCVAAINELGKLVTGLSMEEIRSDMAGFWRRTTGDSQLRWLGPEKGILHMSAGAVINAVWDLYAKIEEKPLWQLITDMSPEEMVNCIDFTNLSNALTRDEALEILNRHADTKAERIRELKEDGYPAYITSTGWLGYPEDKVRKLTDEALAEGWNDFKMKVSNDVESDMKRAALIRELIGPDRRLMMDANQCWEVDEAIQNIKKLARYDPWWIEEPVSPDDVLGHKAIREAVHPIKIATGEHCQNRVMFKQFLQSGSIDICQIDSCRVAGVNEVLSIMLMAAKFDIPVCPHAGGVGLCEYVQHLSIIDYVCISGTLENRITEYVDHLHEHFVHPVKIKNAAYVVPEEAGYSIEIKKQSRKDFAFPEGKAWQA